jgi:hypothetical protein
MQTETAPVGPTRVVDAERLFGAPEPMATRSWQIALACLMILIRTDSPAGSNSGSPMWPV